MPLRTPYRVLYVDNDEDTREMIRLLLNLQGVEVSCSDSSAAASARIQSEQFDLLMLDVWLRGLDGVELCRLVRRSDSKIPILFYSGAAYDSDKQKGLEAGADAYLVKPNIDGLMAAVFALLERPRSDRAGPTNPEFQKGLGESPLVADFFGLQLAND